VRAEQAEAVAADGLGGVEVAAVAMCLGQEPQGAAERLGVLGFLGCHEGALGYPS
jgi:hypothetical protein